MQVVERFELEPFRKLGPIDLRSNRGAMRTAFGEKLAARTKGSGVWAQEIDCLNGLSVQVSYRDSEYIEQVAVSEPYQVSYRGVDLVGTSIVNVAKRLETMGHGVTFDPIDRSNADCASLGLAFFLDGDRIEAVSVHAQEQDAMQ